MKNMDDRPVHTAHSKYLDGEDIFLHQIAPCACGASQTKGTPICIRVRALPHSLHLYRLPFPPSSRSCPTATTKLMATSSQGASGPSGHAGLLHTSVQPVSGSRPVSGSVLTQFEQPSQERLISNEIRKLTVSFSSMRSTSTFTDRLMIQGRIPGTAHGTTLSLCRREYPPDRLIGVVRDKGED